MSNFRINVTYDNKVFHVNVTRTSTGVVPNSYFATIITAAEIANKYPTVSYSVSDDQLLYDDKLDKLLPGFAELQKNEIVKYLSLNNIECKFESH